MKKLRAKLQGKLPGWIMLPPSVALPFGAFQAALEDPSNAEVASALGLAKDSASAQAALLGMLPPKALYEELQAVFAEAG